MFAFYYSSKCEYSAVSSGQKRVRTAKDRLKLKSTKTILKQITEKPRRRATKKSRISYKILDFSDGVSFYLPEYAALPNNTAWWFCVNDLHSNAEKE